MAFRSEVKNFIIPFPNKLAMHDWWIGVCMLVFGKVFFIDKKLIKYRRHDTNVTTGEGRPFYTKLFWRARLIYHLFQICLNTFTR